MVKPLDKKVASYRASVAGIVIDDQGRFLLVQLLEAEDHAWDFVKGGIDKGETLVEALSREMTEELGDDFQFDILEKSRLCIIYDWPAEKLRGPDDFRGQARASHWVRCLGGEIELQADELRAYKWVEADELKDFLIHGHFDVWQVDVLLEEYRSLSR